MHDLLSTFDWDELRYFLAAAREGGLGAGARRLGAQQSTVSRRVAALEARLGAPLFDRRAGGLALTALGERVREEAEAMEQALGRVTAAAAGAQAAVEGVVKIATTETMASVFLLPRVLPTLLARHPGLRVDLIIGDLAADLGRREADLALRFFLSPSGDLITQRVARLETGILAHARLAATLAEMPPASWPWTSVWLQNVTPPEQSWLERSLGVTPRLTTNSFQTQLEAVRAALGVAVLPRVLCAAMPELVALPTPWSTPTIDVHLVTPRVLRRVPRVAAVWAAVAECFAALPHVGDDEALRPRARSGTP